MKIYRSERLIEKGSTLHIFTCSGNTPMPKHTHDFIEIVYVREGSATETVNDATYEIRRGDFTFINYGSTHEFVPHERFSYTNICFAPETLEDAITPENAFALLQLTAFEEIRRESDSGVVHFHAAERAEVELLLDAMQREYAEKRESWQTVLKSYMNVLLVKMLRKITAGQQESGQPEGVWQELSDYIDQNLGGELSLSALAGKCFYNPSYFSRAFKEKFGTTLTDYIAARKAEHAARLAEDAALSVEQIVALSGFASKSALNRAFLKVKGVGFSEYRQKQTQP